MPSKLHFTSLSDSILRIEPNTIQVNSKYLGLAKKKEGAQELEAAKPNEVTLSNICDNTNIPSLEEQAIAELITESKGENVVVDLPADIELPILVTARDPTLDSIVDEGQRFKADVESRPDEATIDEYEKIPVDAFGKALLRGMGWSEGAPIGVTNPKYALMQS
jgi:hypothetical protein